jgi:cytochrome P450
LAGGAEALAFLLLFLFAGHENMMNFVGNAAYALIESPDQLELLRRTPALAGTAVNEILRFESPVQFLSISLAEAVTLGEWRIAAGDTVLVCIGSANRDEARFADPDRLDLTREDCAHLGFGFGPFTCIGAALARLQGEIAIAVLAPHMCRPSIRGRLQLRHSPPVLRGFVSLDMVLDG